MQNIGGYPVIGVIGSGGFGTVYLATDPGTGERVAIKVLDRPDEDWRRAMFRAEGQALLSVSHPNVVRVRAIIETPDLAALVTDYVEGASLREVIRQTGGLTGAQALRVLHGALQGLSAVHAAGLVHADLKPDNILLDRDGESRLIDFGLAAPPRGLAGPDTWIGTPAYLAPEVVLGQFIDLRADIYAAAIILFELLVGRTPYVGPDAAATAQMQVQWPVPDPRSINATVTEPLAELCMQDLAKDAGTRHQSSAAFTSSLAYAADEAAPEWRRTTLAPVVASALAAIPAGLGLLGAAVGSGSILGAIGALGAGGAAAAGGAGAIGSGVVAGAGSAGGVSASAGVSAGSVSASAAGASAGAGGGGLGTVGASTAVAGKSGGALAAIGGAKGGIAVIGVVAVAAAGTATVVAVQKDDPAPPPAAAAPAAARTTWSYLTADNVVVVRSGAQQIASVTVPKGSDGFVAQPATAWSADGHYLAVAEGGKLTLVDADDGATSIYACPTGCAGVAFQGDRLAIADGVPGGAITSLAVPGLDDLEEVATAPAGTTWNQLQSTGDALLAFGSTSKEIGYRGGEQSLIYTITASGTATRIGKDTIGTSLISAMTGYAAKTTYGGPRAAFLSGGSGGACVYGYTLNLVDPADPSTAEEVETTGMFANPSDGEEYGTIHDLWFDSAGVVHATASSNVCAYDGSSGAGVPLQSWHLDGTEWVFDTDEPLLSSKYLPDGSRIDLTLASDVNDPNVVPSGTATLVSPTGAKAVNAPDVVLVSTPGLPLDEPVETPTPEAVPELITLDPQASVNGRGEITNGEDLPDDFAAFVTASAKEMFKDAKAQGFTSPDCDADSEWIGVEKVDPRGFAVGGVGACGGATMIWRKVGDAWAEYYGTQDVRQCAKLEAAKVPSRLLEWTDDQGRTQPAQCFDASTNAIRIYVQH